MPAHHLRYEIATPPAANGHRTMDSRRIVVGGLELHTWVAGQGDPVVLVHGFGVSGRYMLPLAQSLAERQTVFVPELPGYGRSQKPHTPLGIGDLAVALAGCLDALGLDRPAFIANSMGCQVVTELAVRLPERVGPLALIGPTVDPQRRLARRQLLAALRDSAREPLTLLARAAYDDAVHGVGALVASARSALTDRIEQRLPLIEQPTLVLCGEADGFVSAEWAEQVVALLPRSALVVIPGEPHAVHYTRPHLVARIVRELLLEVSELTSGHLSRAADIGMCLHGNRTSREPRMNRYRSSATGPAGEVSSAKPPAVEQTPAELTHGIPALDEA